MTRVLLVYHDENVADVEGDALRRAGYEVDRCAGPVGGQPCPVLEGLPCWQVEKADVLVYDTWDAEFGDHVLVDDLLGLHPDKPLVLTSDPSTDGDRMDRQTDAGWIVAPTRADLAGAIELALQRPRIVGTDPRPSRRAGVAYGGPRW